MNFENTTNIGMSKTVSNGNEYEINWNANYDGEIAHVNLIVNTNGKIEKHNYTVTNKELEKNFDGNISQLFSNPKLIFSKLKKITKRKTMKNKNTFLNIL
jgi:hypothetical protein